jgi:hypothetical protein
MNTTLTNGYLCVRTIDGNGAPVIGGSWAVTSQNNGWYTAENTALDAFVALWRANTVGAEALFALFGPQATLQAIAAVEPRCAPARELWASALGGNATAQGVMRRWPIWRITGSVRNRAGSLVAVTDTPVVLFPEGMTLPTIGTAFPWRFSASGSIVGTDGAARVRVNSISRPALLHTLGGYQCHTIAEDEPPR